MRGVKKYFSLIKFSHTVFALPFALVGFFLAAYQPGYALDVRTLFLIVLCMVFARSAAMAFNRYLDRDIDAQNPRTAVREIPSGAIKPAQALFFVLLNAALFIATTYFINPICFYLSPVALLVILGYSYTKRFTAFCHFVLGLGLSLAPIGAYLAVTGEFAVLPLLFSAVVLFWVSGFDIIYALQDEQFDREHQLHSMPARLGRSRALRLARLLHLFSAFFMLLAGWQLLHIYPELSWLSWLGIAVFLGLLFYQHTIVTPDDLSRVNLAFFTTNGLASVIFGVLVMLDFWV